MDLAWIGCAVRLAPALQWRPRGRGNTMRTRAAVIATVCVLSGAGLSRAEHAAVDGSLRGAGTLKAGQTSIGVLMRPTAVGLSNRVQLGTHWLKALVGIPSIELAVRIVDGKQVDVTAIGSW